MVYICTNSVLYYMSQATEGISSISLVNVIACIREIVRPIIVLH